MGQLKHDGRATQGGFAAPAATAITFGDLYRINQWNGIAMKTIGASDTDLSILKFHLNVFGTSSFRLLLRPRWVTFSTGRQEQVSSVATLILQRQS
jgi:hypothetical protein